MDKMTEITSALKGFKDEVVAELKKSDDMSAEKIVALEKRIEAQNAEILKAQQNERKVSLPGSESEAKNFSFSSIIKAQVTGSFDVNDKKAMITKEIIDQVQKSNNTATGAAGGYLIPEEFSSEIIDLAMANTPFMSLGVTKITGLKGDFSMPKVSGRPTAYWVGEEQAPTESNTTFGQINFRKRTLAALTKISEDAIYQSSNVIEQVVRDQLVKGFALAMETAFISGTGTNGEPLGIKNFSGLTSTSAIGANGGRFKYDKGGEMITAIDVANMLKPAGKYGFLMRPEVLRGLKSERIVQFSGQDASSGSPIYDPFTPDSVVSQALNGYKLATTTLLSNALVKGSSTTCSNVFFGDWSQFVVAMWEGFTLRSSAVAGDANGSAFTQRQIWITAFQGIDTGIKDATGLTKISDAETLSSLWA